MLNRNIAHHFSQLILKEGIFFLISAS